MVMTERRIPVQFDVPVIMSGWSFFYVELGVPVKEEHGVTDLVVKVNPTRRV